MSTTPQNVLYADLLARPADFDGVRITLTGIWSYGMEHSEFAGAWLRKDVPPHWIAAHELHGPRKHDIVSVTGTWRWRGTDDGRGGFGHMGIWPGELETETLERVIPGRRMVGFDEKPFELPDLLGRQAFDASDDKAAFCDELSVYLTLHVQGTARPAAAWLFVQNAMVKAGYGWAWDVEGEQLRYRNEVLVIYTPHAGENPLNPDLWDWWESPYQFVAVFPDDRHRPEELQAVLARLAPA